MDKKKETLADCIWFTRIARTKAEQRLIDKEKFIQFVNIYYSLFAISCSIISFVYNDRRMGLFTIFITIGLMVSILYLNGQKYLDKAKDYRDNYTELQMLEYELDNIEGNDIENIQMKYCRLLKASCNHIYFDYLKAVQNSNDKYQQAKKWNVLKWRYYWECTWRVFVKVLICFVPFGLLYLCEVFVK